MQAASSKTFSRATSVPAGDSSNTEDGLQIMPTPVNIPRIPQLYSSDGSCTPPPGKKVLQRSQSTRLPEPPKFLPLPGRPLQTTFARKLSHSPHSQESHKELGKTASLSAATTPVYSEKHTHGRRRSLSSILPFPFLHVSKGTKSPQYSPTSTDYRKSCERLVEDIKNLNLDDSESIEKLASNIRFSANAVVAEKKTCSDEKKKCFAENIGWQDVMLQILRDPKNRFWLLESSHLICLARAIKRAEPASKAMLSSLLCVVSHTLLTDRLGLHDIGLEELGALLHSNESKDVEKASKVNFQTTYLGSDSTPDSSLIELEKHPEWIDEIAPTTKKSLLSSMRSFIADIDGEKKERNSTNLAIKGLFETYLTGRSQYDEIDLIKTMKEAESYLRANGMETQV